MFRPAYRSPTPWHKTPHAYRMRHAATPHVTGGWDDLVRGSRPPADTRRHSGARSPWPNRNRPPSRVEEAFPRRTAFRTQPHRRATCCSSPRLSRRRTRTRYPRPGAVDLVDDRIGQSAGRDARSVASHSGARSSGPGRTARTVRASRRSRRRRRSAGHRPVEALDECHAIRACLGDRPERVGQLRVAAALDDEPAPRASSRVGAAPASRSNPFCGSSRPIIPITGRSSAGSNPIRVSRSARQAALPLRSSRENGAARSASVAGSQTVVSRPLRIPRNRSPFARRAPSRPIPKAGVSASLAKPGETVLTSSPARSR